MKIEKNNNGKTNINFLILITIVKKFHFSDYYKNIIILLLF